MFSKLYVSIEGHTEKEVQKLSNLIVSHGGEVHSVITDQTTHLIVNPHSEVGFQEISLRKHNNAWVVNSEFITSSVRAGVVLPEMQFSVSRKIESLEKLSFAQQYVFPSTREETLQGLADILLHSPGGQLWGICTHSHDVKTNCNFTSTIPRYLLGGHQTITNQSSAIGICKHSKDISSQKSKKIEGKEKISSSSSKLRRHHRTARQQLTQNKLKTNVKNKIQTNNTDHQSNQKNNVNVTEDRSDEELFVDFAGGSKHISMISQSGDIWSKLYVTLPRKLNVNGVKFCKVSCGRGHTLALSVEGEVYSWGEGYLGQLGQNIKGDIKAPTKIMDGLQNILIVQISAFANSSSALSKSGGLFTWGENKYGQLGLAHTDLVLSPKLISHTYGREIRDMACGGSHMVGVTRNGELLSWGSNRYGQLGRSTGSRIISSTPGFVNIPRNFRNNNDDDDNDDNYDNNDGGGNKFSLDMNPTLEIQQISCGMFHSALLLKKGEVYAWGLGTNGRLGIGETSADTPTLVQYFEENGINITHISCGDYHTTCRSASEWVYLMGELKYGIAGHAQSTVVYHTPTLIPATHGCKNIASVNGGVVFLISDYIDLLKLQVIEGNLRSVSYLINGLSASGIHYLSYINSPVNQENAYLLHIACEHNCPQIVEYLLAKCPKIDVNIVNRRNETPLHIAAKCNSHQCIRHLLTFHNIEVDAVDRHSNTPLMVAVKSKAFHALEVLILAGANKSIKDNEQSTPLHVAIKMGYYRAAILLVRNAASITDRDANKKTPLEYCSHSYISGIRKIAETNECFISYAHKDMDFAYNLRMELNKYCLRCWMDDWRLQAGGDWRSAIGEGLMQSSIVLFIASKTSVVSDWCLKELYLAISANKKIVIIEQEDTQEQEPYLDILIRDQLRNNKSKFSFKGLSPQTQEFNELAVNLSHKLHSFIKRNNQTLFLRKKNKLTSNLDANYFLSSKIPFVVLGLSSEESSFGLYLKSELNELAIPLTMINTTSEITTNEQITEEEVISKCWVYFLMVNESLTTPRVLRHIANIENNNKILILIFQNHDDRRSYWPAIEDVFNYDQIEKFEDLFSFYMSDPEAVPQIIHTLNLLQKERLLNERIILISHKADHMDKERMYMKGELNDEDILSLPREILVTT